MRTGSDLSQPLDCHLDQAIILAILKVWSDETIACALMYIQHHRRRIITPEDMLRAMKFNAMDARGAATRIMPLFQTFLTTGTLENQTQHADFPAVQSNLNTTLRTVVETNSFKSQAHSLTSEWNAYIVDDTPKENETEDTDENEDTDSVNTDDESEEEEEPACACDCEICLAMDDCVLRWPTWTPEESWQIPVVNAIKKAATSS